MGKRRILVLYGSQTGTAQAVAERIGREANADVYDCDKMKYKEYLLLIIYAIN